MRKNTAATTLMRIAKQMEAAGSARNADLLTHMALHIIRVAGQDVADNDIHDAYTTYQKSVAKGLNHVPEEHWVPLDRHGRPLTGLKTRSDGRFKRPEDEDNFVITLDQIRRELDIQRTREEAMKQQLTRQNSPSST